jgi:menaquinol-cytochrome c reductase iron-sulfur subunit
MRPYSRRRFLSLVTNLGGAYTAALLATPIVGFLLYPIFNKRRLHWVTVGPIDDIAVDTPTPIRVPVPSGEGWATPPQDRVVYVVRHSDGSESFFANICTHMQCDVHWDPGLNQFLCPCHGGLYDIHGRNVGGPPPSPLPEWRHRVTVDAAGQHILEIQNELNESI